MKTLRLLLSALLLLHVAGAQQPDSETIFREWFTWAKTKRDMRDLAREHYRARLIETGLTPAQADERLAILQKTYATHQPELQEFGFNLLYSSASQTRFTMEPNAYLKSVIAGLKPGKALDVAMGQGRNAVYLAAQGWDVTGFDIAEEGMKVARSNAGKAGTRITTVRASFEDFDYGRERWDLIYFVYTDAPVVDPKYVERVCAALKKGGLLLIERPYRPVLEVDPEWPAETEQDKPNALVKAWWSLQIVRYEDTVEIGEWQQTQTPRLNKKLRMVRLLARKL